MRDKQKIALFVGIVFLGWAFANEARLFKPTNYLECKTNRGTFYLKIIQRTYKAEEYPSNKFKEDEIIKSFDVDINKNYIMLSDDMGWSPPPGYSKTDSIFPINRKTLKIYDPLKRKNLGQCTSQENKI